MTGGNLVPAALRVGFPCVATQKPDHDREEIEELNEKKKKVDVVVMPQYRDLGDTMAPDSATEDGNSGLLQQKMTNLAYWTDHVAQQQKMGILQQKMTNLAYWTDHVAQQQKMTNLAYWTDHVAQQQKMTLLQENKNIKNLSLPRPMT
uniref:Uncharacterized protein n=1 Tax=Oryza rufipogon TaxID=4529 RepID=A0A0E0P4Y6_ORYRU